MRRLMASALVLLCFAYFAPPALATPILINGSFESSSVVGCCWDVGIQSGSSELTGWKVLPGGGIDWSNPPWKVSDGLHAIDLDGRNSYHSGVAQSFATEVGKEYQVLFDLSGNPDGGPDRKDVRVAVGDFTQDYSFEVLIGQSISTITWASIAFTFLATDTTSTLSFMSLTPYHNSYGALIDNVCVTDPGTSCPSTSSVPDPGSTLLLFGMGLAGLGAWRKRLQ